MLLSIVIVNYNVRRFLDQALDSIRQSETSFTYEVIVVDNGSTDGSVEWGRQHYPWVKWIHSEVNLGFAKANNLAAKRAKGEFLLLLNPDTLVRSDTLQKTVDYMQLHNDIGALGVRMYDGTGAYLPESKRGFPGPWASFCKIVGLNRLFPHSKIWNYYYMGHLDPEENQKVDVLTGAFMMLRRQRYLDIGGLDEEFFMYGEDIDLCYRLSETGHTIYYLADSSIIHFKGESTKKRSLHYIKTFYSAMSIYARKHYHSHVYAVLGVLIQAAIFGRASLALLTETIRRSRFFVKDWFFVSLLFLVSTSFIRMQLPFREMIGLAAIQASCWYIGISIRPSYHWWDIVKPWLFSWIPLIPLIVTLSLPFWPLVAASSLYLIGWILFGWVTEGQLVLPQTISKKNCWIFSSKDRKENAFRLLDLLPTIPQSYHLCAKESEAHPLEEDILVYDPTVLSWDEIIGMIVNAPDRCVHRVLVRESNSFIESRSKNEAAKVVNQAIILQQVWRKEWRRKRKFDMFFSTFILVASPFLLLMGRRHLINKALEVLFNEKTWVGVMNQEQPSIRTPLAAYWYEWKQSSQSKLDPYLYLSDYSIWKDLQTIFFSTS